MSAAVEAPRPGDIHGNAAIAPPAAATILSWLLHEARTIERTQDLVDAACRKLVDAGVPLARVIVSIGTIHPEIRATGYHWERGARSVAVNRGHDILADPAYLNSPFRMIHETSRPLRRRLIELEPDAFDFPILHDLVEAGITDYLVLPLRFSSGTPQPMSLATDHPDGFAGDDVALMEAVMPALSLVLEVHSLRRTGETLLDTYLGRQAGRRVLRGQIRRGAVEVIHAVIMYADLRGFTAMSDALPRDELIGVLDVWFGAMTKAVARHDGEVLKFIGDGILAIFPLEDASFRHFVSRAALAAAREAKAEIDRVNTGRAADGREPLRFGLALNLGDVLYGNIGGADRLDFTVIGPAVNLTARLEKLAGELGRTVVLSPAVAEWIPEPLVSCGWHSLRGVAEPVEVFCLPED